MACNLPEAMWFCFFSSSVSLGLSSCPSSLFGETDLSDADMATEGGGAREANHGGLVFPRRASKQQHYEMLDDERIVYLLVVPNMACDALPRRASRIQMHAKCWRACWNMRPYRGPGCDKISPAGGGGGLDSGTGRETRSQDILTGLFTSKSCHTPQ